MLIQPSQADVRRFFCGVYAKARAGQPLEAIELLASQWIAEHPEFHAELTDVDAALASMTAIACPLQPTTPGTAVDRRYNIAGGRPTVLTTLSSLACLAAPPPPARWPS